MTSKKDKKQINKAKYTGFDTFQILWQLLDVTLHLETQSEKLHIPLLF